MTSPTDKKASGILQLAAMFIVYSLLLFTLSFINLKENSNGFKENKYENIIDKIRYAQVEYYHAGRSSRRKIVVQLQKRTDIILELRGYAKNMVDERYFVCEQNWNTEMTFTVNKCCENVRQVQGLMVNGKPIFTAKRKYQYYNGNAIEKALIEGVIGLLLLFSGCVILYRNWGYLKK